MEQAVGYTHHFNMEGRMCAGWGLAVMGTKYSAHQTKVEKYSVDRLSLAGVWLLLIGANYMKIKVSGLNMLAPIFLKTNRLV